MECLYGYFFDGVVLTTGCDKTTPAMIMGACTVNLPAIVLSGGPMLDGHFAGGLAGSGTIVWYARQELAAGRIDLKQFLEMQRVMKSMKGGALRRLMGGFKGGLPPGFPGR